MAIRANTRTAKTLAALAQGTDALANIINNRSIMLTDAFVTGVLSLPQIGYPGRRPRSLTDTRGNPRLTDMDLASFLIHLTQKPTAIEIPEYSRTLPTQTVDGVTHTSKRRFGEVLSLSSHRTLMSFGITIRDMSVVARDNETESDHIGLPRTFNVINHQGEWHDGWQGLAWRYRENEKAFRERYELSNDRLHRKYQYFVHPNRRQSFASRAHLLLKLLCERLYEERAHFGFSERVHDVHQQVMASGPEKYQLVPEFTMKIEGVVRTGDYPSLSMLDALALAEYRTLLATTLRKVQFLVRLNEYGFFKYGLEKRLTAPWVRGDTWHVQAGTHEESGYIDLAPGLRMRYALKQVGIKVKA